MLTGSLQVANELPDVYRPKNVEEVQVWAEVGEPVLSKGGVVANEMLRNLYTGEAEGTFLPSDFSLQVAMPRETAMAGEGHVDCPDVPAVEAEQGIAEGRQGTRDSSARLPARSSISCGVNGCLQ